MEEKNKKKEKSRENNITRKKNSLSQNGAECEGTEFALIPMGYILVLLQFLT